MFEEELEDDFLTAWKPTKMDIDVDVDHRKVSGPKSTVKTKFASSKMEMDFDFDGGFSKLSSFDIDLSFDSPASPAKKTRKTDLSEKPKPVNLDNDLEFDLKGFETENLEDVRVTKNGKLKESKRHRAGGATVTDHEEFGSLRKGQTGARRDASPEIMEDRSQAQPDSRGKFTSSLSQPEPVVAHYSSQDTAGIVHHEKNVHTSSELASSAALETNGLLVSPVASKRKAASMDNFQSRSGLESESPQRSNPVLESDSRRLGESPSVAEESKPTPGNSRQKLISAQVNLAQDLERKHAKQQPSDPERAPTPFRSSTTLTDQKEACASLDSRRCSPLRFDPLSKSSQNSDAALPQTESYGHPDGRHESKCFKLADEAGATTVEKSLETCQLSLSAPGPPLPVATRPAIASLSLNETRKDGEKEASALAFNRSLSVVPCVTLGKRGRDNVSKQVPAVSIMKSQIPREDHVLGKQNTAKEDPTRGHLKFKAATKSGNNMMEINNKSIIPNKKEHSLCVSKRPSREIQSGLQRASPVRSGKGQGDSCGTHVLANREREQKVRHNVVGSPTAVAPVDGTIQGHEVQNSIIRNVKAPNMLSSRTVLASRFFATDPPMSTEKETGHQIHTTRPDLGQSSKLITSASYQMRAQMQPTMLVGDKHAVRNLSGTSGVSRGKGLQTKSSSKDIAIRPSGNLTARPQAHGIGCTPLQSSTALKAQVDGRKVQADRSRQKGPSLERVNQNLPISTETLRHLPAQASADLLISQDIDIEELYCQYTDKLDSMLNMLRKLNDEAKNFLVRAHITNNKLRMLNCPMIEFKKLKKSVMQALGTHPRNKQL